MSGANSKSDVSTAGELRDYVPDEILRWPDVHRIVKLSRTTIQKLEKLGKFPKRVRLTDYSIGWLRSDVDAWLASRRSTMAPAAGVLRMGNR